MVHINAREKLYPLARLTLTAGLFVAVTASSLPVTNAFAQPASEGAAADAADEARISDEAFSAFATRCSEVLQADVQAAEPELAEIVAENNKTDGERAVDVACDYIGTPYVYGGSSPSGFDCSGFTSYVYRQLGISLPRIADSQRGAGSYVSSDELESGDLVFFGSGGYANHVGMYVGDGDYIHSPQTGSSVRIDSLSERSNYMGACRPW